MSYILRFEFQRIFASKKNLTIFLIIILATFFFIYSGVHEYKRSLEEKQQFQDYEKEKTRHYQNYSQYGAFGYRLFFQPSPIVVFFSNSNFLYNIESNIDTSELIKVYHLFKGRRVFESRGYFKDFSGFIFLAASLFMIYMGMVAIKNLEYLKFNLMFTSFKKLIVTSAIVRILLLLLFFILLMFLGFWSTQVERLQFSRGEIAQYFHYCAFALLFLVFFYLLGMVLAVFLKFRRICYLWMFTIWFVFIFLIPEFGRMYLFNQSANLPSNESINLEKLKALMAYEHEVQEYISIYPPPKEMADKFFLESTSRFVNNVHLFNRKKELELIQEMRKILNSYEIISAFFPTQFYRFLGGEISSKGYYGYLDYKWHVVRSQEKFLRYYIKKKFILKENKVEPFVKDDENVFQARSCLPGVFWLAFLVTAFYSVVMFCAAYFRLKRLLFRS